MSIRFSFDDLSTGWDGIISVTEEEMVNMVGNCRLIDHLKVEGRRNRRNTLVFPGKYVFMPLSTLPPGNDSFRSCIHPTPEYFVRNISRNSIDIDGMKHYQRRQNVYSTLHNRRYDVMTLHRS